MPFPKNVDATIRAALDRGVDECALLEAQFVQMANQPPIRRPNPAHRSDPFSYMEQSEIVEMNPAWDLDPGSFAKAREGVLTLLAYIAGEAAHPALSATSKRVSALKSTVEDSKALRGIVKATKESYLAGLYEPVARQIEASISGDYLARAEELLDEGQRGKFDHVPAAALLGAVFENKLRSLCRAQTPPIDTRTQDGRPKKAIVMVDDLKKANVYGETRAKDLRLVASVRNHAAHGEFDQFSRADVEKMRLSVGHLVEEF